MFRRLADAEGRALTFIMDGQPAEAREGDSVAAALLANGALRFRLSAVSGSPRGPYCMMGTCFECLVTVDGIANRQACLLPVRPGMRVETGHGKRELV